MKHEGYVEHKNKLTFIWHFGIWHVCAPYFWDLVSVYSVLGESLCTILLLLLTSLLNAWIGILN